MKANGSVDMKKLVAFLTGLSAVDFIMRNKVFWQIMTALCEKVVKEARRRAPVDEGHLERDIVHEIHKTTFGVEGKVFLNMAGESGDYALKMHEDIYKLGELSKAKQSREGVRVGNKFLERAINDCRLELQGIINEGLVAAGKKRFR